MDLGLLWILVVAIVLMAGFVQGLVGFGSGLVMVPVLVLLIEPKVLIPAVLVHGLIMNEILAIEARRHIQAGRVAPILLGGIVGLPLGTYLLVILSPDVIKVMIGTVIVVFGLILLSGRSFRIKREKLYTVPIGLVSGLLNGSVSMSGPPVILFFANQNIPKKNFRANTVTYFFFLNVATLFIFTIVGLITRDVLVLAGVSLPFALLGIYIGTKASKVVNEKVFRRIALILVSLAGLVSLIGGIVALVNRIYRVGAGDPPPSGETAHPTGMPLLRELPRAD
ncbi:MAG: sulfite exporter TauE/SafE family protein [Thermoplasmatota archaeon]